MALNIKSLTLLFVSLLLCLPVFAGPTGEGKGAEYVDEIEKESEGNVTIDIPATIMEQLFPAPKNKGNQRKGPVLRSGVNRMSGYRIQVFSESNSQRNVESRAKARGSAIVAKFPKYRGQVYSYSKSPNWYTRIGNFMRESDANAALAELKRAFPRYASEMRLVKCEITVIK